MKVNWLKTKIQAFIPSPKDYRMIIGADAENLECYATLFGYFEDDEMYSKLQSVLTQEDFEALSDYLQFGERDCGSINTRLMIEIYEAVENVLKSDSN